MAKFQPTPGMRLQIGASIYEFVPHPLLPRDMGEVYVIEGGEAIIYQIYDRAVDEYIALKLMKFAYRGESIARATAQLQNYVQIPGLALCQRVCLTRASHPQVIALYPELEYAILMPWISGRSWAGFMQDRVASERYQPANAITLAMATAQVMWELEAHHVVHTDIAGSNIVFSPDYRRVELLDLENIFIPQLPARQRQSQGTPGYQHRHLPSEGQRHRAGDRFAGAILLAEMLAWADPAIRAQTSPDAESLFQPQELQDVNAPRFQAVRHAIWNICTSVLPLFDQAWTSKDLMSCPEMGTWALTLIEASVRR
ncbi:MAG TPA: serine/threonine-protein kinase [Ktedonobacterales bacterium]|nr:serine/threonine-protein kinase [Ktedonobacterales bacterium]